MNNLTSLFKRQFHYEKLDSTSSFLKRNYKKFRNLTFVSSDFQTDGHGRMGRTWESNEKENLMFSFILKDKKVIKKYDSLSLAIATAVFKAFENFNLENVSIKWPNDIYANDKKLTGILLEGISYNNEFDALVIGVGVNLNQKEFINSNATSYYFETKKEIDISSFKNILYKEIKAVINQLRKNDHTYLDIVRSNNYLLDKEVYAEIDNKKELVKVLGINDDNSIIVKYNSKVENLRTGEITFHKDA